MSLYLTTQVEKSMDTKAVFVSIPTQDIPSKTIEKLEAKKPLKRAPAIELAEKPKETTINISDVSNLDITPHYEVSEKEPRDRSDLTVSFKIQKKNVQLTDPVVEKDITDEVNYESSVEQTRNVKVSAFELSYDRLPEKLINDYGNIKSAQWTAVKLDIRIDKKVDIAKANQEIEKNEDRISTEVSAPERSALNRPIEIQYQPDELVFFDYSSPESQEKEIAIKEAQSVLKPKSVVAEKVKIESPSKKEEVVVVEPPKSSAHAAPVGVASTSKLSGLSTLEKAIEKWEMVNRKKYKEPKRKNSEPVSSPAMIASAEKVVIPSEAEKNNFFTADSFTCEQASNKSSGYSFEYSVSLKSIGIFKKQEEIRQFEIRFSDDLDEIQRDFGEGRILLKGDLSGSSNIRRGTLYARGHFPTTLDIVFEGTEADLFIPALSLEKMEDLTQELGVSDSGAHLLVELDETTEDVELGLDHKYNAKVYLDQNYNIVDRGSSEYFFVLFIGVEAGNVIVNFQDNLRQVSTKIVHLSSQEIYYEPNFYAEFPSENVSFFEEGVMTNCQSILQLNSDQIEPWSFVKDILKENLNTLNFKGAKYPLGSRKYVQLKHLDEPVFVGFWGEEQVAVPSEEYMNQVLSRFDIRGGECVVQLNLEQTPTSIKYNGISNTGGMNTELRVLDADGKFYNDPSDQTKRVFIKAENQGIISIEFTYPNNTKQYLQTFCSENTFLVEQL